MSIYLSRSFRRSNSSSFLCSGNALQSEVLRLREEMFLVNAGFGTPRICMQDELRGVPINRATRFEKKVGFLGRVAGESLIKKRILERFFIDLVAGESLIKERAATRFKDLVGSTDVVAGEPLLLLPRKFRQNRAWMELNKIWRTNKKVKGFILNTKFRGYFVKVAIAGFITFFRFRKRKKIRKKILNDRFTFTIKRLKWNPKSKRTKIRLCCVLKAADQTLMSVTKKKRKFLVWGQELDSLKTKEIGQARGLRQCENTTIPITS